MEINLVETWAERAGNSIEALKIMGMGMLSIFIVIAIITIIVYIMNMVDKKMTDKKNMKTQVALQVEAKSEATPITENGSEPLTIETNKRAVPSVTPTTIAPSQCELASSSKIEDNALSLSDMEDSKYRKGQEEVRPESVYRKNTNSQD